MARSLLGLAFLPLLLLAAGCSGSGPINAGGVDGAAACRDAIDNFKQNTDLMSTITDTASARAAADQLLELATQGEAIKTRISAFKQAATSEQERQIDRRYGREIKAAAERAVAERDRIKRIPGVPAALAAALRGQAARSSIESTMAAIDQRMERESQAIKQRSRERLQKLIQEHGRHKLATVMVDLPRGANISYISGSLSDAARIQAFVEFEPNEPLAVKLIPCDDFQALADNIAFGKVTKVDSQQRVIHVQADAAKMPPPLPPAVNSPTDPNFYPRNLADLTCYDPPRRSAAAQRLANAELDASYQADVACSLEDLASGYGPWQRSSAARALRVWGTVDNSPTLVRLLDDDSSVVVAALEALAEIKDPRSAEAVARQLDASHGFQVATCLKAIGSPAESAVAPYVAHADAQTRYRALGVLKEIATEDSVPMLLEALQTLDDSVSRGSILKILGRVQDPRAAPVVADMAFSSSTSYYSFMTCLKEMGPAAETVVAQYLGHADPAIRTKAVDVLKSIASEETIPRLIEYILTDEASRDRMVVLAIFERVKDERAIPPAAMMLLEPSTRIYASRCLKAFGPAAEETVLKGFEYNDTQLAVACCRILEEIGTQKSFDPLLKLTRVKDVSLRMAAQKAGQAIVARVGPPSQSSETNEDPAQ